jgi:hypothetical protein
MSVLSSTTIGQAWLLNFDADDKPVAKKLLDRLLLGSASEFSSKITLQFTAVAAHAREGNERVSLYAEREMTTADGDVLPFFPRFEKGRATGQGVQPSWCP